MLELSLVQFLAKDASELSSVGLITQGRKIIFGEVGLNQ